MLVVICVSFQGGGPGSDDKDMANPFNRKRFTACVHVRSDMEILLVSKIQVRQAISELYKEKEENIKFLIARL